MRPLLTVPAVNDAMAPAGSSTAGSFWEAGTLDTADCGEQPTLGYLRALTVVLGGGWT